jgi:copper(I)-binding protein
MMRFAPFFVALGWAIAAHGVAQAQDVAVQGAWARATVQGQQSTGAFMTLTSRLGSRLVSASSPVAGVVEVHEMKMEGDVMKMRAVQDGLELPAGKAVELKPGGLHVMLMDLKQAVTKESTVPLTLVFKNGKGQETRLDVKLAVGTAPLSQGAAGAGMGHGKGVK